VPERRSERNRPLYMISVAAELAGVHPQTLRIYERKHLVAPQRSSGNTRLYSQADVDQLREIQRLTQEEGVNLAGVTRIIELQNELECVRAELARAVAHAKRAEASARVARMNAHGHEVRAAIVRVERGAVVRRYGQGR
jgi:MerR family transcriptional regulator, heat shock protein HspR